MARIMYDRYLTDADCSVNITNADTEYLTTTAPESFINPPIKMRFLSTGGKSFEGEGSADEVTHSCCTTREVLCSV